MTNDPVPRAERALQSMSAGTDRPEDAWHERFRLISDLTSVNKRIAVFVLRVMDADADHAAPPAPATRYALGTRLVELGNALRVGAQRHDADDALHAMQPSRPPQEPHNSWAGGGADIYVADSK